MQALLLVRDDFWMATTRLLRAVEVPLVEGTNAAAVELFDARHARKVLEEFGRSLGQIPAGELERGERGALFLDQAVAGIDRSRRPDVPVRLSLFVEVVRGRPWTLQTLAELGGWQGSASSSSKRRSMPRRPHRPAGFHRAAAGRAQAPAAGPHLPDPGRSAIRPRLREASGYADRPGDFADLLQVLDHDLRLITAVDVETVQGAGAAAGTVDPRGSARRDALSACPRLPDPADPAVARTQAAVHQRGPGPDSPPRTSPGIWLDRPGAHRLPSVLEYLGILHYTRPAEWTAEERRLMRAATRHYLGRLGVLVALIAALVGRRPDPVGSPGGQVRPDRRPPPPTTASCSTSSTSSSPTRSA